jgi:thiamine phosphate synthase YjbQ (UPF0047 family)
MKFHTEYLTFHTKKHRTYVHITAQIDAIVGKSGIKEGMVPGIGYAYHRRGIRE